MSIELGFEVRLTVSRDDAIDKVTDALKAEGFGVLTRIEMDQAFQEKIGKKFRPYTILGACNPPFAHKALQAENKIGTMLPCNVVVQDVGGGKVEVAAIDPVASMQAVENPDLGEIAGEVRSMLQALIAHVDQVHFCGDHLCLLLQYREQIHLADIELGRRNA